jgi:nucleoside-diphosphate-sugar epimerase
MERMAVTGGAGFIGSNLVEFLLAKDYPVVVVDNFSTGRQANLEECFANAAGRLEVLHADVNETSTLREAFRDCRYVFHLAANPSVQSSVTDPQSTHHSNIDGTVSVLLAARDAGVKRVVVASSCAVYGDDPHLPKAESDKLKPLSPYALSKWVGEEYCRLFHRLYGLETVCLRYFNVFGPRQDRKSEYAAVIPKFVTRLLCGMPPIIYGDGEQTRDFIYVANILAANWKAVIHPGVAGEVFNIGCGTQTSLNRLVHVLNQILGTDHQPCYEPCRAGEVRHSVADVNRMYGLLRYSPEVSLEEGLRRVLDWYRTHPELLHGTT